jgi:hypothetical protein
VLGHEANSKPGPTATKSLQLSKVHFLRIAELDALCSIAGMIIGGVNVRLLLSGMSLSQLRRMTGKRSLYVPVHMCRFVRPEVHSFRTPCGAKCGI